MRTATATLPDVPAVPAPPALDAHLAAARQACLAALAAEPLARAERLIAAAGWTGARRGPLVEAACRGHVPELFQLRDAVNRQLGAAPSLCLTERVLVLHTALDHLAGIPGLRVDDSVKQLFCRDIICYADPERVDEAMSSCAGPNFASRLKVASLRRFPAGQTEWEVSGFPRSWLARIALRDLPRTVRFLATRVKGFGPLLVGHMSVRRRQPFLTARGARLATYRAALVLDRQPEIRGLMGVSWLHSRETFRISPHLAFMNQAAEEMRGFYVDLGAAPEVDGFLEGNRRRAELYRLGAFKPTLAAIVCPREQVLDWMRENRHLEGAGASYARHAAAEVAELI
ncbi:MAG TPA: hypothetical protein VIC33_13165 [Vicinamibacterales bacterium]|jgi:hypothetical protein